MPSKQAVMFQNRACTEPMQPASAQYRRVLARCGMFAGRQSADQLPGLVVRESQYFKFLTQDHTCRCLVTIGARTSASTDSALSIIHTETSVTENLAMVGRGGGLLHLGFYIRVPLTGRLL